jgi:hypothetical protein
MLVFADPHFEKTGWDPTNLKVCAKGTWNDRMMVETVLSMLTVVCLYLSMKNGVTRSRKTASLGLSTSWSDHQKQRHLCIWKRG